MSIERLREIALSVRNWGRWGPDDEIGTLNYITPEAVAAACRLVSRGKVFSLGVPLQPHFEHALLVLSGDATLGDQRLDQQVLYYLGTTRSEANVSSREGCRLLLIGGPPFSERILMWWNFVARTQEEIAQARADWEQGDRFGEVAAYKGARLRAPSLVRFARPNPVS